MLYVPRGWNGTGVDGWCSFKHKIRVALICIFVRFIFFFFVLLFFAFMIVCLWLWHQSNHLELEIVSLQVANDLWLTHVSKAIEDTTMNSLSIILSLMFFDDICICQRQRLRQVRPQMSYVIVILSTNKRCLVCVTQRPVLFGWQSNRKRFPRPIYPPSIVMNIRNHHILLTITHITIY